MTFDELLTQAVELLQREGRVSYRALKRRFALDDEYLEDLKAELIDAKWLATDEDGKVLVWIGNAAVASSQLSVVSPQPLAERRQLTVMFCDLVGSTALSTQLDPEELREAMQAYQQACVTVISRFEGYVGQYLGDGLLVYFGYPAAHEDDAARAARAGLGITAAIQALSLPPHLHLPHPLQVRVGIHTGLVVIGEIGSGEYRAAHAIVGETPNIAARLQDKALPNSVVISPTTARLVAGLFECQDLGPQLFKGLSTPMAVYQVIRESEAQSRFEVSVRTGLTPLIGRAHEIGLLRERWERAKQVEGQAVLLSGEAGIGKSRLVQELKEQVSAEGTTCLAFRCSPYHQNSAFYPIIEHVQRLLQFPREEMPQAKLVKLQHALAQYHFPQADTLALLAALLSLPHPEGAPPITLSPQKQKQKTQEALVSWLMEEAERQAVVTVWEDLHWADPSTRELLSLLLDQVPTSRLFVVLTARPEFQSLWSNRGYLMTLTLNRLPRTQAELMVQQVTGNKAVPAEVLQQIVAKTDGVPLFVEELTKTVVESGLLTAVNDHYELSGPLPPLAIPATLQDSLMARLDRLATVKEVAQLGATLGREFSYEVLRAVALQDESTLQQALAKLVEAEVLYQRGLPPQAHYLFKHALIQDTAYQSLLKSTRQQYHRQIGQVLEERFTETVETQPELLAHHYTEAGLIEQALLYWQKAGERATQRSAYMEAVAHLTKGLEVLKALPDTPARVQQELTLQFALGTTLMVTRGYAAPEVEQAYARVRELCRQLGETPQLVTVLWRLVLFYLNRGELQTAHELAEQMIRLAQSVQDQYLLSLAHMALGWTLYYLGKLISARPHLEQAIALYDPQKHPRSTFFTQDPRLDCLSVASWTLWYLGYSDQGLKRSQEALDLARGGSYPFTLACVLVWAARFHLLRREGQLARERAEAVLTLATEQGFPQWVAWGTIVRGWALAEQGQVKEGIAQMQQGLAALRAMGTELNRPWVLAWLAEAYGKAGPVEEGLAVLAEALEVVNKTGERVSEAELYRLKGTLTLQEASQKSKGKSQKSKVETNPQSLTPDPQGEAEACFYKAIEIARQQQAKSLELRAAMSLARLWQQQGKQHEARNMLAEIYGWFSEGFDTKDLQEAKALLTELNLLAS